MTAALLCVLVYAAIVTAYCAITTAANRELAGELRARDTEGRERAKRVHPAGGWVE